MIIGLTGAKGSGKDTVADFIMAAIPEQLQRYALAGPIKELADRWLGLNTDYESRGIKESLVAFDMKHELFECLDLIIYDMFRNHDLMNMPMAKKVAKRIYHEVLKDNMYCNVGAKEVKAQKLITTPRRIWQIIGTEGFRDEVSDTFWLDIVPKGGVLITDVRFSNEAEWVSNKGGALIDIVRDNLPSEDVPHTSELGVPAIYVTDTIYNNRGVDILMHSVESWVDSYINSTEGEQD